MDMLQLRHLQAQGLPKDPVCTENAIVLQHSRRPSLMIDPQMQVRCPSRGAMPSQPRLLGPARSCPHARLIHSALPRVGHDCLAPLPPPRFSPATVSRPLSRPCSLLRQANRWIRRMGVDIRRSTLVRVGKMVDRDAGDAGVGAPAAKPTEAPASGAARLLAVGAQPSHSALPPRLEVVTLSALAATRKIEAALTHGWVLLVQDLTAEDLALRLDSVLAPLIKRETFKSPLGEDMVLLTHERERGERGGGALSSGAATFAVPWHPEFELLMTTKLASPSLRADLSCRLTFINFRVTREGLEEQFLALLVAHERPELEAATRALELSNLHTKGKLRVLQDRVLRQLRDVEASLLEDDSLIESLNLSKDTAASIRNKLEEEVRAQHWLASLRTHASAKLAAWRASTRGAPWPRAAHSPAPVPQARRAILLSPSPPTPPALLPLQPPSPACDARACTPPRRRSATSSPRRATSSARWPRAARRSSSPCARSSSSRPPTCGICTGS
jgi:hypothetical protein